MALAWTGNTSPAYTVADTKGGRFPRTVVYEITGADVSNGDAVAIAMPSDGAVVTLLGFWAYLNTSTSTGTSLDPDIGSGTSTFTNATFEHLLNTHTAAAWIESAAPENRRVLYIKAGNSLLIKPNPDAGADNDVSMRVVFCYGVHI